MPHVSIPIPVWFLLVYLSAITVIGKGPTYLPFPPIFWGEVVLASSLLWLVYRRGLIRAIWPRLDVLTALTIVFIGLGAVRTLFSLAHGFHLDVIRDSAIWYYGLLYFVGAEIARQHRIAERVWRILVAFWVAALFWGAADLLSGSQLSRLGPVLPWRGEPLISNTANELVQHMALGAMIAINPALHRGLLRRWVYLMIPISLVALTLVAASRGRGAKVGILLGLAAVLLLRFAPGKKVRMSRHVLIAVLAIALAGVAGFALLGDRLLQQTQFDRFLEADPSAPKGTAYWRVIWWENLVKAVRSQNVLFGLGFGDSLSIYNPYLQGDEQNRWPVRSPHNVHITILSRMGWVGAGTWLLLVGSLLAKLFRAAWSGRSRGQIYHPERREEIAFWMLMIIATLGNSSFGVLMEGPVLGVWFWFAAGFASGRTLLPVTRPVPSNIPQKAFAHC